MSDPYGPPTGEPSSTVPPELDDDRPVDDVDELEDVDHRTAPGAVVKVVHLDAGGQRVERLGQVVEHDDESATVRVAYFGEVSDPIPLDHTVHGREDAARVELAG